MAGREAGTAGYDRAADYVAARYAEIGLQPAGGNGGWLQAVPLLRATLLSDGARLEIERDGRVTALALRDQFLPGVNFNSPESMLEAPAVFVGQAVHAPELDHDDFAGLELDGRIAVMFGGAPGTFDDTRRAFHSSQREKLRNVVARGAVGAVFVNTVDDEVRSPWSRAVQNIAKPAMRLRDADGRGIDTWPQLRATAVVSAAAADALFEGSDRSAAQLFDAARAGELEGFALPGTLRLASRSRIEPAQSSNVVGRIAGSDPALAGQYVALGAHADHVGFNSRPVDHDSLRTFNAIAFQMQGADNDARPLRNGFSKLISAAGRKEQAAFTMLDQFRDAGDPRRHHRQPARHRFHQHHGNPLRKAGHHHHIARIKQRLQLLLREIAVQRPRLAQVQISHHRLHAGSLRTIANNVKVNVVMPLPESVNGFQQHRQTLDMIQPTDKNQ